MSGTDSAETTAEIRSGYDARAGRVTWGPRLASR